MWTGQLPERMADRSKQTVTCLNNVFVENYSKQHNDLFIRRINASRPPHVYRDKGWKGETNQHLERLSL